MEKQLLMLFARLSKEAQRCKIYAMRAEKDRHPELAGLYKALALSHLMQAHRFLVQVRGSVGPTSENEITAFTEELPELLKDYQAMLLEAEKEGSKALETGFRHSSAVQRRNLDLYRQLKQKDKAPEYFVCDFCGFVATGKPPDNCPVCTAPKNRFVKVEAD